jgi:hypothetical protein
MPRLTGVVAFTSGDDAAGAAEPLHLLEHCHRTGDVLEHLMSMHDVETAVGERHGLRISASELDVLDTGFGADLPGFGQNALGRIDGDDRPRVDETSEVASDSSRTAANVEQVEARPQVSEQIGSRVLCRAGTMRPEDAVVVPVCVHAQPGRE